MPTDLVLLTGATGHVGFGTLKCALEYGYQVRAAVRSEAKVETIRSNPALQAMDRKSQLDFIVVPDFTVPDAFDAAVQRETYRIPPETTWCHFGPVIYRTIGCAEVSVTVKHERMAAARTQRNN